MKRKFLVIIVLIMLTQLVMPLIKVNASEKSIDPFLSTADEHNKYTKRDWWESNVWLQSRLPSAFGFEK